MDSSMWSLFKHALLKAVIQNTSSLCFALLVSVTIFMTEGRIRKAAVLKERSTLGGGRGRSLEVPYTCVVVSGWYPNVCFASRLSK